MSDVSFIQTAPDGSSTQDLVDARGGSLVSGAGRLAQRVILELLTEQGSVDYLPLRGTRFLTILGRAAHTEADVLSAFAASRRTLKGNLQAEESPTDPPSERFAGCDVAQVVVVPGAVQLALAIRSRAGVTTGVTVPVLVFYD